MLKNTDLTKTETACIQSLSNKVIAKENRTKARKLNLLQKKMN